MNGVIKNYRRGRHTVNEKQLIIEINGINSRKKATSLTGSKVKWSTGKGTEFNGRIVSAHGSNGTVRALFKKGLPGQCIGEKVEVLPPKEKSKKKKKTKAKKERKKSKKKKSKKKKK